MDRGVARGIARGIAAGAILLSAAAHAQTASQLNARGVESYEATDWSAAVGNFESALRLEPGNATIVRNYTNACQAWASSLAQDGNYAAAIVHVENAIQNEPENPMPLIQLGAYYLHESRVREAIYRLEEAIELSPDDVDAHYLLGEAYYRDNDVGAALDQWEWVESVEPSKPGLAERIESARREIAVEGDYAGQSSRHFNVTFDREAEGRLVRDVVNVLEQAYREIGRALGNAYPPAPIQVSLYTSEGFQQSTMMDAHVGALFDGNKIRCPVIGPDGNPLPYEELRRRLYHEYVHVVVRHLAKEDVPWWFNEGLAEALTIDLSPREFEFLRDARDKGTLFDLRDLAEGQLDKLDPSELYLAYKQSQATVAYLKARHGTRRLAQLISAVANGEDAETALRRIFRLNYSTLQLAAAEFIQNG